MNIMEQDKCARERIRYEIDRNFFVEAGAGSGKTTSLVDRMTAMVGAGIPISQICAITFTKNAAMEFYSRFQMQLIQKSRAEQKPDNLYARALRNIDLCFMDTIDSFANMILNEHPMEAGIPSGSTPCEDEEAGSALMREYVRMKRGEYPDTLVKKYDLFRSVQKDPDDTFRTFISMFASRREAEFIYTPPADVNVSELYQNWSRRLVNALKHLQKHPEQVSPNKDYQALLTEFARYIHILSSDWNLRIGEVLQVLKKLDGFRLYHDKKGNCIPPEDIFSEPPDVFTFQESARLKYYAMSLLDTKVYCHLKDLQYAATVDFLASAAEAFSVQMCSSGRLTFHDAKLCLRDMLRRDAEAGGRLIRHISKRHSFFLVDEFQDTDPVQAEIVFYLTAQEPCADWTACVPRPGSLFIVGDPKQSIYRFRGADIGAFMRVRKLFEQGAGEILSLSRNFRSTVKLCQWFNTVFPEILHEKQDLQSAYPPIPLPEDERDTEAAGIYTYTAQAKGLTLLNDDTQIAAVVQQLAGNPAIRLQNGKAPEYKDIMIITPGKGRTEPIAEALKALGIPSRVEGMTAFEKCPALSAGIDVLEAVANPTDAMAVYTALVSPVFGIAEQTITRFCNTGGKLHVWCEQEEHLQRYPAIARALAFLREHASAGQRMSTSALFDAVTDDARVFAAAGSDAMQYFCYARELLRHAEEEGTILKHADGAAFLRRLTADDSKERCVSLSPDENRVYIANLHKVKGLEAPIVILAYPYVPFRYKPGLGVVHRADGCQCRFFALSCRKNNCTLTYAETDAFSAEQEAEAACMEAEEQRKLYVAATRARNILIIGNSVNAKGEQSDKNPWKSLLPYAEGDVFACIPENPAQIKAPVIRSDSDALYAQAEANSVLNERSGATYRTVSPSRIKLNPVVHEEAEDAPAETEAEPLSRNAALTGTLVHRLMECLVSGGVPAQGDTLLTEILHDYGAEEARYRPILEAVLDTMKNGGYPQENGAPADLLAELRLADAVYCEMPFCQQRGGELVYGIMDLVYCKEGTWHIVDYKTTAEYLRLEDKYAEQLKAYRTAFRELTGEEADAWIYHISTKLND